MPTKVDNVLNWASDVDGQTIAQAQRTANLPFVFGHVALMPDAHVGKGATIGSVVATKGAIVPSAVGVDLGCGVNAVETSLTSHDLPDDLSGLHSAIAREIPAGVGKKRDKATPLGVSILEQATDKGIELSANQWKTASRQLGTLGSGNHFVEVCLDERDVVWLMLHSGSRGIGLQLAQRHIDEAKGLMQQYFINLDDPDLAYLVEGTDEFNHYITAMLWSQDYAAANRSIMMEYLISTTTSFLDRDLGVVQHINCHHNFCEKEHHNGHNVWVTRKGAIRARIGDLGIIPGSMGSRSYIVEGLGSPASYNSCSHGAGRRLSRSKARKTLDLDTLKASMQGRSWNESQASRLIDEDPRAYKDIDQVMADQADLARPLHTLTQILNYKGL